jgi:hypothetical protein
MVDVVVSKFRKDVAWAYDLQSVRKVYVYEKECSECPYNIPVNRGHEASVYLKYIVDHYDTLSDFTLFVHDENYSWHHNGSISERLNEAIDSGKKFYNINKYRMESILTNDKYPDLLKWYATYIEPYIPMNSLPNKDFTNGHLACAQFLVHSSVIRNLPRKFYENLYHWIIASEYDSKLAATYLEWTWHIFWDLHPTV